MEKQNIIKRIYELIIDENDDISGLDSISLVDQPAIEVDFLYFKKDNSPYFDIPEDQDAKYASIFGDLGEYEENMLEDGWVIESEEPINYESFAVETSPNAESVDDTENTRVRYKYGLHPNLAGQEYIIPTSREYCRTLVGYNKVFRREDILSLPPNQPFQDDGGSGGAPYRWRGGYNCRHYWWKITYKKDGKIVNNANVNINKKTDSEGREITQDVSWSQPSTVVEKAKGTLNYSKDLKFAVQDEEKHIVIGPAMIPDMEILRRDENGEYYVYFSVDTIKQIAEKFMRKKLIDQLDAQHNGEIISDIYVVESWIKEFEEDKSVGYGYGDLPIGTWFISVKVNNQEIWDKVKNGDLKGFSVAGYFAEAGNFSREEQFLRELAELLKNY